MARQQAQEVLAARAAVELVELVRALGRIGPRPVQPVALAGQGEELGAVLAREHAQPHARAGRRVGRDDVGRADGRRPGGGGERAVSCEARIKAHGADGCCVRVRRMTRGGAASGPAIDARAAVRPELGGVERWARELCARLPVHACTAPPPALSHRAGHAWEQFVLPVQSARADALLCPANLAPLAARNVVVILHDAAPLRHPGWYSGAYAAWQRRLLPLIARRAARGHHRLPVLAQRARRAA